MMEMTTITLTIPVSEQQAKDLQGQKKLLEKIGAAVLADYAEIEQDKKLKADLAASEDFADLSAKLRKVA
jgi:hypothetical protein